MAPTIENIPQLKFGAMRPLFSKLGSVKAVLVVGAAVGEGEGTGG